MTRYLVTLVNLLQLARKRHDHVSELNLEARLWRAMVAAGIG